VVIHYEEALYQVYAPLPLMLLWNHRVQHIQWSAAGLVNHLKPLCLWLVFCWWRG